MATSTWTAGAGDGNLSTGGNWIGGTGGDGTIPQATDDVVIGQSSADITSGAVTCATFKVTEGFRGSFSTTSGGSLAVTVASAGAIDIAQAGARFCMSVVTSTTSKLRLTFVSNGTFGITAGTLGELRIIGTGRVDVDAAAIVTALHNNGGTVNAGTNGTAITLLTCQSGQVYVTGRNVTTAVVSGSRLILDGSSTLTTGYIGLGGTINDRSSGTFTTLYVFSGGTYTPVGTTKVSKTITNLYSGSGSSITRATGGFALTVTNEFPM